MTGGDRDPNDRGKSFAELIGDDPTVERSEDRIPKVGITGGARRKRRPANSEAAARASHDAYHDAPPDDQQGVFRGEAPPAEFRELRSGRIRPGARIDLHRLDSAQARHALRKAFGTARAQGERCVLVIHGRGRRSPGGEATLKSALPGWLRSAPLDEWVRSFAPALPRDGGDGASYVLLRAARHPQSPRQTASRRGKPRR